MNTTVGANDYEATVGQRIGDKLTLRGVGIKAMLELNERFTDVTFRIIVVKAARADTLTRATLFNGESGNKMMDSINKERYTVIAQKFVKLRSNPVGTTGPEANVGEGVYLDNGGKASTSRATRIVRMWIPGTRFTKSGIITYENGTNDPKFFDYHVVCYAYSNYSTAQDIWNVGRVNEFLARMYYKDA